MAATLDAPTARVYAAAYDSPAVFAERFLGLVPTKQQRQFFDAIAKPGAHVGVRSGHGTGKTTVLAAAAIWYLFTRKDALVPCTAPTAHQLQDVLWREMRRLINNMAEDARAFFSVNADRIAVPANNSLAVARTARPENPDALQGFHAPEILFIIDEAAGVHNSVYEVARGALSTPGARVALAGNPTQLTGYFFNAFHGARDSWTRLHFSCLDSPLVAPNYAREIAAEYGEDSDMYRVRVLGDFPKQGLLSIVPAERVELALKRVLPSDAAAYASTILGVDPAWMGSDRSAVALRQGIFAKILFAGRGVDGHRLGTLVSRFQGEYATAATFVDQTGVGASVVDFLRGVGRQCTPVAFGGTPIDAARFTNRRAEMWWKMREWFMDDVALAPHPDIMDDLIGPEYGVNGNGKIYLESKDDMRKRGLASPDLGDALALTFAVPVGQAAAATVANRYGEYDFFAKL